MICCTCKKDKQLVEFTRNKAKPLGCNSQCKECKREYNNKNRKHSSEMAKLRHQNNKEETNAKHKIYMHGRKEENSQYQRSYYNNNKEQLIKKNVEYMTKKLKTDPYFKMKHQLKGRIRAGFSRYSLGTKSMSCSEYGIDFEAIYLRIGPRPSAKHHLDHIIPLFMFDLSIPEQVKLAHVPNNLRWVEGKINLKKNKSIQLDLIEPDSVLREIYTALLVKTEKSDP